MIVNGVDRTGRILQAKIAAEIAAGEEIFGLAGHAAIFELRRDRLVAAAVNADTATR